MSTSQRFVPYLPETCLPDGHPFRRDHYEYRLAENLFRLNMNEKIKKKLIEQSSQYPKFHPRNLATIDVPNVFAANPTFFARIMEVAAKAIVFTECGRRNSRDKTYDGELITMAAKLRNDFHDAIELTPNPPKLFFMTHTQLCFAELIADLAPIVPFPFHHTLDVIGVTDLSTYPKCFTRLETVLIFVDSLKMFLTRHRVIEQKNQIWAKITYNEFGATMAGPIVMPMSKKVIVIAPDAEADETQEAINLTTVYSQHKTRNKNVQKARNLNPAIRLELVRGQLLWLHTKYGQRVWHDTAFPKHKNINPVDRTGFQSLGPIVLDSMTACRLIYYNSLRRISTKKLSHTYEQALKDWTNVKIAIGLGEDDKVALNTIHQSPCMVNIEIFSDALEGFLKQPNVVVDPFFNDFVFMDLAEPKTWDPAAVNDAYQRTLNFMLHLLNN